MKLRVVWVGKTRDPNLAALQSDFAGRIRRFLPLEIAEVKDSRQDPLLEALGPADRVVAMDADGRTWSSKEFAGFVAKHMRGDPRALTFVIGGHDGLSVAVKKRAEFSWSLSPLTFTHDMARVLLLEQIYRALATIHNHPYPR